MVGLCQFLENQGRDILVEEWAKRPGWEFGFMTVEKYCKNYQRGHRQQEDSSYLPFKSNIIRKNDMLLFVIYPAENDRATKPQQQQKIQQQQKPLQQQLIRNGRIYQARRGISAELERFSKVI